MNRLLILSTICVLSIFNFVEAVNEQQLRDFLVEYNSRSVQEIRLSRLPYAIEHGYIDIASFFVRKGDAIGSYSLPIPIELGKINYFPGCEERVDGYIKHSLVTAIRKGYNQLAVEMLQMGADIYQAHEYKRVLRKDAHTNVTLSVDFKSVFYVYVTEGRFDLDLLTAFLTYGLDVNKPVGFHGSGVYDRYQFNNSPLALAIGSRRLEDARILLEKGAYVDSIDTWDNDHINQTPLFFAVLDNCRESVLLLLEFGADPLFSYQSKSPLELAVKLGYEDLANLLISVACD